MFESTETPESQQNTGGGQPTKVEIDAAELADLKKKAEVSSQNFERLKKIEAEKAELEAKVKGGEAPKEFDSSAMERKIDEKVDLRLAGYTPEMISEIESYAKGKNISLSEAAKSPFIQKAVDGLRAEEKSKESTPAPSSRTVTIGGKNVDDVLKTGTPAEKQAAWEALTKPGVKNNE